MTTRRTFLVHSTGLLALAGAASLFPACASVVRGDFTTTSQNDTPPGLDAVALAMLELASLAPSSHNVQPWLIRYPDARHWSLETDARRRLPVVDPDGREMWLSLGAFLENLDNAARNRGLRLHTRCGGSLADGKVLLDLAKDSVQPGMPDAVLRARRTVRKGLLNTALTTAHVHALLDGIDGARFVAAGSPDAARIAEAVAASTEQQNARRDAMRELSEWIHWSNREAAARRDGLTPASMDITGVGGLVVRTFFSKESVTSPSFARKGNAMVREQVGQGGGWLLVAAIAPDSLADTLDAGRRFERLALRACRLGIAVHPMSQPLEEEPWSSELTTALGGNALHFLLRVGYVEKYPEPVSLRRPVRDFAIPA
ncbi:MAG: hypothetical protein M5R41_06775 [Bacteroidia bacterium]|nr:hypothetical protein [Bacteroidia bacterium]